MQTEEAGLSLGKWTTNRTCTTDSYSIKESQKVGNDSPGFPHVCIQRRPQGSSSTGELGIKALRARGERRNPSWELAGNERMGTFLPLLTRAWKPQWLREASVLWSAGNCSFQARLSSGCVEVDGQWLQGWVRSLCPGEQQNPVWGHWDFSQQIWIPSWKTKKGILETEIAQAHNCRQNLLLGTLHSEIWRHTRNRAEYVAVALF